MQKQFQRRTLLTTLAAAASGLFTARASAALVHTPPQTEGPFYPRERDMPSDRDNDLVRIKGKVTDAGGEILHLHGDVRREDGSPVKGARVEIWQCDANGSYLHGGARSRSKPRDDAFQGFGFTVTDDAGNYDFRTIKPVAYPGRTPHIHAKVITPDGTELTTQFYVADDPQNQRDGIYMSMPKVARDSVTGRPKRRADGELEMQIRIVV